MLVKTILYENGVQTVVVFDTEKPMWNQEVKVVEELFTPCKQPQEGLGCVQQ